MMCIAQVLIEDSCMFYANDGCRVKLVCEGSMMVVCDSRMKVVCEGKIKRVCGCRMKIVCECSIPAS